MEQLLLFGDDEEYDPDRGPRRGITKKVSRQEKAFAKMLDRSTDPQGMLFAVYRECARCGKTAEFSFADEADGWIRFEIVGISKSTGFLCSLSCIDILSERRTGKPDTRRGVPMSDPDPEIEDILSVF